MGAAVAAAIGCATAASADECDALAAGISGATLMPVTHRRDYGGQAFVNFDIGKNQLAMLSCGFRTGFSLDWRSSNDAHLPPPAWLGLFVAGTATLSSVKAPQLYALTVSCEQAALRDENRHARISADGPSQYLYCDVHDGDFIIGYNDDRRLDQ